MGIYAHFSSHNTTHSLRLSHMSKQSFAIFLVKMVMDERCHAEIGDTVRLAVVRWRVGKRGIGF